MPSKCLLLTGFEPFDGASINGSWEVAKALHGRRIAGHTVRAVLLPCVFGQSLKILDEALRRYQPALVLALGLAAGRAELSLERVAVNLDDARIPDNAGAQPVDRPVVVRGPAAHFSTLPVKAMAAAILAEGVPAGLSHSAGSFVCNHVFYGLQHRLRRSGVRSGFMHLPALPEQAQEWGGLPWLTLADQVRGTRAALLAALSSSPVEEPDRAWGTIA